MAGILTPLQLTAAAGLLANTGLKPFPPTLMSAIVTFNATTVITNFIAAVNFYKAQSFATQSTLESLLSIGSTDCPALGNSIPTSPIGTYPYLRTEYLTTPFNATDGSTLDPSGFSNLIEQTCAAYLGNGDVGRFAQGFMAVQGYINTTNQFINSAVNAQTYLGPTFTNMDALITNSVSDVNPDFGNFATDLANQGNLTNLNDIKLYGTPAGLLRQLAAEGNMVGGVFAPVQTPLLAAGLSAKEIQTLLAGPSIVSDNEYLRLQQLAYRGMANVKGTDLQQVLNILEVTTPNITDMTDLLDQTKIFPNSYTTLLTPTPNGPVPVYGTNGSVNMNLADNVSAYLASPNGCEDLGKVIPPAQAVANKAVQVAFEQITNITNSTIPAFADTIDTVTRNPWTSNTSYLANAVVANAPAVPTVGNLAQLNPGTVFYRAQQDVPAGVSINNDDYWLPTTLGCGLSTMADLPLIQAQTTPIDPSVAAYFSNTVATGTGPDGTITTCDVIGLAIDHDNFASQLTTATTAINALQPTITAGSFVVGKTYTIIFVGTTNFVAIGASANTIGVTFTATGAGSGTGTASQLAALNTAYTNILSAANDAAVLTQITNANNAISALSASPYVTTLNTAWTYMANLMNLSAKYTTEATIDYFTLPAGDKVSTMSFVQQLSVYGTQTCSCGPAAFLNSVADTTMLAGQGIVGAMREGKNNQCLGEARLNVDTAPNPQQEVSCVPAVIPVY